MKILICTDGSITSNEGIKCVVGALRKDNAYTVPVTFSPNTGSTTVIRVFLRRI